MTKQQCECVFILQAVAHLFWMVDLPVATPSLAKTVSYRELAESKLLVNDKWNNQIRAELLKASYLPLNSQAC